MPKAVRFGRYAHVSVLAVADVDPPTSVVMTYSCACTRQGSISARPRSAAASCTNAGPPPFPLARAATSPRSPRPPAPRSPACSAVTGSPASPTRAPATPSSSRCQRTSWRCNRPGSPGRSPAGRIQRRDPADHGPGRQPDPRELRSRRGDSPAARRIPGRGKVSQRAAHHRRTARRRHLRQRTSTVKVDQAATARLTTSASNCSCSQCWPEPTRLERTPPAALAGSVTPWPASPALRAQLRLCPRA
jgi:hypothetical protein